MTCRRTVELWWAEEDADYIRHHSTRYAGALNLEPAWAQEAMADERLLELAWYTDLAGAGLRVHRLLTLGGAGAGDHRLSRSRRGVPRHECLADQRP
jgi:hypothetical protein